MDKINVLVQITNVIDPHNFHAQISREDSFEAFVEEEARIDALGSQLATEQRSGQVSETTPLGSWVLVKSDTFQKWVRGQVNFVDSEGGEVDVKCVDYGWTELIQVEDVLLVTDNSVISSPAKAYQCRLAGIAPIADMWISRACNSFKDLVLGNILEGEVVGCDEQGIISLNLTAEGENGEPCSVADMLFEEGLARLVPLQPSEKNGKVPDFNLELYQLLQCHPSKVEAVGTKPEEEDLEAKIFRTIHCGENEPHRWLPSDVMTGADYEPNFREETQRDLQEELLQLEASHRGRGPKSRRSTNRSWEDSDDYSSHRPGAGRGNVGANSPKHSYHQSRPRGRGLLVKNSDLTRRPETPPRYSTQRAETPPKHLTHRPGTPPLYSTHRQETPPRFRKQKQMAPQGHGRGHSRPPWGVNPADMSHPDEKGPTFTLQIESGIERGILSEQFVDFQEDGNLRTSKDYEEASWPNDVRPAQIQSGPDRRFTGVRDPKPRKTRESEEASKAARSFVKACAAAGILCEPAEDTSSDPAPVTVSMTQARQNDYLWFSNKIKRQVRKLIKNVTESNLDATKEEIQHLVHPEKSSLEGLPGPGELYVVLEQLIEDATDRPACLQMVVSIIDSLHDEEGFVPAMSEILKHMEDEVVMLTTNVVRQRHRGEFCRLIGHLLNAALHWEGDSRMLITDMVTTQFYKWSTYSLPRQAPPREMLDKLDLYTDCLHDLLDVAGPALQRGWPDKLQQGIIRLRHKADNSQISDKGRLAVINVLLQLVTLKSQAEPSTPMSGHPSATPSNKDSKTEVLTEEKSTQTAQETTTHHSSSSTQTDHEVRQMDGYLLVYSMLHDLEMTDLMDTFTENLIRDPLLEMSPPDLRDLLREVGLKAGQVWHITHYLGNNKLAMSRSQSADLLHGGNSSSRSSAVPQEDRRPIEGMASGWSDSTTGVFNMRQLRTPDSFTTAHGNQGLMPSHNRDLNREAKEPEPSKYDMLYGRR